MGVDLPCAGRGWARSSEKRAWTRSHPGLAPRGSQRRPGAAALLQSGSEGRCPRHASDGGAGSSGALPRRHRLAARTRSGEATLAGRGDGRESEPGRRFWNQRWKPERSSLALRRQRGEAGGGVSVSRFSSLSCEFASGGLSQEEGEDTCGGGTSSCLWELRLGRPKPLVPSVAARTLVSLAGQGPRMRLHATGAVRAGHRPARDRA